MSSKDFNLDYLADLANIKLKKSEKKRLDQDLENILDYVDKLREQKGEKESSLRSSIELKNSVRKDLAPSNLEVKNSQKKRIKEQAAKTKRNYFVIPQVLKR